MPLAFESPIASKPRGMRRDGGFRGIAYPHPNETESLKAESQNGQ